MSAAAAAPTDRRSPTGAPCPTVEGFRLVRGATEALAAPLSAEDQTVQTMADVSPTKWHRAHVTWFFEQFVLIPGGRRPHDERYLYLFNSYYEGAGPRHPRSTRGHITRPGVAEIAAYRADVDGAVSDLLAAGVDDGVAATIELGLHHEQQHQELLLMDIKHVLGANPFRPAYQSSPIPAQQVTALGWRRFDGGVVETGAPTDGDFTFDNETPTHRNWVEPFAVADRLVSCGEWLEFMDDGGYETPSLWLSDGWAWVQANAVRSPLYWSEGDGGWRAFTLAGDHPVDPAGPVVHVNYYEADAFARWAGARLPTEVEWEHASSARPAPVRTVDHLHPVASRDGGWYSQVWQWTASAYLPYPRFAPALGVVGEYNGKFMSGQHVLRGSACVTPAGHARLTYRNFFPPSARWAFTGLRLARDA